MRLNFNEISNYTKSNSFFIFKEEVSRFQASEIRANILNNIESLFDSKQTDFKVGKKVYFILSEFLQATFKLSDYKEYIRSIEIRLSKLNDNFYLFTSTDEYSTNNIENYVKQVNELNSKSKSELKEIYRSRLLSENNNEKLNTRLIELLMKIDQPLLFNILKTDDKVVLEQIFVIKGIDKTLG